METARGGAGRNHALHIEEKHSAVFHRDHIIQKRAAFRRHIGLPEDLTDADIPEDAAVSPVVVSLNVQAALGKDKNIVEPFALPQDVFSFLISVQACREAGQHGADVFLTHTGKELCPPQHRNKLFHKKRLSVVNTTELFDSLYYNQVTESRDTKETSEMIRKIIKIDEEKCNGCGLCAKACHEGAIDLIDGKARLVRENFCDGFGDCLPNCPAGAISFEEREAPAYDEAAVKAAQRKAASLQGAKAVSGCPGSRLMQFQREAEEAPSEVPAAGVRPASRLNQWPCQLKLVPAKAPFLDGAKLLIAADCTAYAYANMHEEFMKGKITVIGCPKLDDVDYTDKLTAIIRDNDIRSVTIVRMEVPCCGGLQRAAQNALRASGKFIPWQVVTISRDGRILD